jgi:hypothetical protein
MIAAIDALYHGIERLVAHDNLWHDLRAASERCEREHRDWMSGVFGQETRQHADWTVARATRYFCAKHVRDWLRADDAERLRLTRHRETHDPANLRPDVALGYELAQKHEALLADKLDRALIDGWGDYPGGVDYVVLAELLDCDPQSEES